MPITELVIPILKPELAKEAQGAIYDGVKGMSGGPIFRSVGHMLRDNGKDVSEEYRAILGLGKTIPLQHPPSMTDMSCF
jgi:hypothetical protein